MDQETLRRKLAEHRPSLQQARGEFAVLVPLVEGPEGLSLLYEVRPAKLHHHSGEVCFPGGRMEPGETPRQCALRETHEELGIPAERIELLGELDFLYLRSQGILYPVLGQVDPAVQYHPQDLLSQEVHVILRRLVQVFPVYLLVPADLVVLAGRAVQPDI